MVADDGTVASCREPVEDAYAVTLRRKTFVLTAGILLCLLVVTFAISRVLILRRFADLEDSQVMLNTRRARNALHRELDQMSRVALDYSAWDDMYAWMGRRDPDFLRSTFPENSFDATSLRLNAVVLADLHGIVLFQKGIDYHSRVPMPVPASLLSHLTVDGLMNHPDSYSPVVGLLRLPDGPWMVAAAPVTTSDQQGPMSGSLVMARQLDGPEVERVAEATALSLAISEIEELESSPTDSVWVQHIDDRLVQGHTVLADIYGRPRYVLSATLPRSVYLKGEATVRYFAAALAVVGLAFGAVMLLVLEITVVRRVSVLSEQVTGIGQRGDRRGSVALSGRDELSRLAHDINGMLQQLEETQAEMVRLERLRALGEMAAGVSHNLNNILMGVTGPAQLMLIDAAEPEARTQLDLILESTARATELIHRLNRSVRGLEDEVGAVDVVKVVRSAVETTRPRWKDEAEARGVQVALRTDLEENTAPILGSEAGLADIVINLLANAIDAVADGGVIRIAVAQSENRVVLSVSDSGVGMSTETRRRIFEPFFTTKRSVGTGLGLSTVHATVLSWGGDIEVQSEAGSGSSFIVSLPVASSEPMATAPEPETPLPQRVPSVLIVEDDDVVRAMITQFLGPDCQVSSCASAQEAERIFEPSHGVVIIDLGLPDQSGDALALTLRSRVPALVTVLVTGWELHEEDPRRHAFDFHLKKPFTIGELRHAIAKAAELTRSRRDGAS